MTETATDKLLTARDVAALLRFTPATVYCLARRGEIPAIRLGRAVRFRRADIDAWLRRRAAQDDTSEPK